MVVDAGSSLAQSPSGGLVRAPLRSRTTPALPSAPSPPGAAAPASPTRHVRSPASDLLRRAASTPTDGTPKGGYLVGTPILVRSKSAGVWCEGTVTNVQAGVATLEYKAASSGEKSWKYLPVDHSDLALSGRDRSASICSSPCVRSTYYSVGDDVEVWSKSFQHWCRGSVLSTSASCVTVEYTPEGSPSSIKKSLPMDHADMRRPGADTRPDLGIGVELAGSVSVNLAVPGFATPVPSGSPACTTPRQISLAEVCESTLSEDVAPEPEQLPLQQEGVLDVTLDDDSPADARHSGEDRSETPPAWTSCFTADAIAEAVKCSSELHACVISDGNTDSMRAFCHMASGGPQRVRMSARSMSDEFCEEACRDLDPPLEAWLSPPSQSMSRFEHEEEGGQHSSPSEEDSTEAEEAAEDPLKAQHDSTDDGSRGDSLLRRRRCTAAVLGPVATEVSTNEESVEAREAETGGSSPKSGVAAADSARIPALASSALASRRRADAAMQDRLAAMEMFFLKDLTRQQKVMESRFDALTLTILDAARQSVPVVFEA